MTGWYALVRSNIDPSKLSVSNSGALQVGGQALRQTPFLIFSIDATTKRDDFAQIPELREIYGEFLAAAKANKKLDAEEIVRTFRRHALLCPELLQTHAGEVVKKVEDELKLVFPGGPVSAGPGHEPPLFGDLPVSFK